MKKYWKLFMLGIFTFSLLSIHYVQAARETSDYLTLHLETVRGDESVVQNRTFYGFYSKPSFYTSATVTLEGYTTPYKGRYVYGMFGSYLPLEMKPLIEQYRSFMRGKMYEPMYYYEDDKRLLYVEVSNKGKYSSEQPINFNISSLTKRDGTQQGYTAITLQSFPFNHVFVEEVQLVDGYIKVVVRGYGSGRNGQLYVFTIDETKRTVIDYKQLTTSELGEDYILHQMYTDYSFAPQTNFLYGSSSDHVEVTPSQGRGVKDFKLYKIDLKTMATAPIDVPEAVRINTSNTTATNDATHFVVYDENKLELYSYHFDNDKWTHVELESNFELLAPIQVFVVDDVLYIAFDGEGKSQLYAYDLATGKELYKGDIKSESDAPFYFSVTSVN